MPEPTSTCPQCGAAAQPRDQFCGKCGAPLPTVVQPQVETRSSRGPVVIGTIVGILLTLTLGAAWMAIHRETLSRVRNADRQPGPPAAGSPESVTPSASPSNGTVPAPPVASNPSAAVQPASPVPGGSQRVSGVARAKTPTAAPPSEAGEPVSITVAADDPSKATPGQTSMEPQAGAQASSIPIEPMSPTGLPAGGEGNESVRPGLPGSTTPNTPGNPGSAAYAGPRSGTLNWSGKLTKGQLVAIEGLPGIPVMIDFDAKEFSVVEPPSPRNGWKRLVIRSRNQRHKVITIRWTAIE